MLKLKIRALRNFSQESGMINHKYPQGMSVLSEHSKTRGRISCWLAAFLCLDREEEQEEAEDSTYLECD